MTKNVKHTYSFKLTLFESRSTNQISSGKRKPFLYIRKLAGTPMIKGVGASNS